MLLCLQTLQAEFGYVDAAAIPIVADVLNVSRAEVHGVLTFYHDLRSAPAPRATVRICVAEACQANGSRHLVDHAESMLGVPMGEHTDDGIGLESVYCLGNCALGPAALIDGRLVGRLTAERFDSVVLSLRSEVPAR